MNPPIAHPRQTAPSTKHAQVREEIKTRIRQGEFPPGSRLPPETELPKILNAGKQTVVRALNDLVREGLIVRRRGSGTYVAEQQHPPLIRGRHLRLGMLWQRSVWPERLIGYFQGDMTEGAISAWGMKDVQAEWARVAEKEPTRATWTSMPRGATVEAIGESHYSQQRHPPLETIRDGRFDGLLLFSIIEEDWIESLLELDIPTAIVDFPNERFALQADQVYVDPLPGYRAAVRRLVDQGAQKIHFVGSTMSVPAPSPDMSHAEVVAYQEGKSRVDPDCYLRLNAYRQGLTECGLPEPANGVHFDKGASLLKRLASMPEEERPDAVVGHNVDDAETLMRAFADRGLSLKGAGATAGGYGGPALAIRTDGRELGRTAAELLIWRLQKPDRSVLRVGVPMVLQTQPTSDAPVQASPV